MIKSLLLPTSIFIFLLCFTLSGSSLAQTKGTKGTKETGKSKGSTDPSPQGTPGLEVISPSESKATKGSEQAYNYLVFLNQGDNIAYQIWNSLPGTYSDFRTSEMPASKDVFVLSSKNPELAMFKRAYGAYFQIFTEDDLRFYGSSLPCLAEMIPVFNQMVKKISSK